MLPNGQHFKGEVRVCDQTVVLEEGRLAHIAQQLQAEQTLNKEFAELK